MTDRVMQISFLPQDIELIRKFLYDKTYSDSVSYNESLDAIYVNLSKVEKHEIVLSRITELIVSIIKDRDLKEYIWTTYTNISEEDKKSVYKEALGLVDKKENFIKETVYSKLSDIVVDYEDINLDGFLKFRMKDFTSYISIVSDIALEEHLIKRDKKEFLDSLKYFIDIQEEKMNLLRIVITKENHFILSDENGNELEDINNKELINLAKEENLNSEDLLISEIMTLCPKKIEILDKCSDIAIVSSDMEFFDEKGVWGKISHPQFPEFLDFVHESPFCHAACMVRKEAYLKVNGDSVGKHFIRVEDYYFFFKALGIGHVGQAVVHSAADHVHRTVAQPGSRAALFCPALPHGIQVEGFVSGSGHHAAANHKPVGGQQVVGGCPTPGGAHGTNQGTYRTDHAESPQNR